MADRRLKLLFDENFSHRQVDFVARESRLAEFQHIRGLGWSGQADTVWVPRAVLGDFCIVSGDRNERTRGHTAADLRAMNARVILVGAFFDHLDRWQRAKWLVGRADVLVRVARDLREGTVLLMGRTGQGVLL